MHMLFIDKLMYMKSHTCMQDCTQKLFTMYLNVNVHNDNRESFAKSIMWEISIT